MRNSRKHGVALESVRLFALVTSLLSACSGALPQDSRTWSDEEVLNRLAPELEDAMLLTMADLTDEQRTKGEKTPGIGRRFEGDFNSDGQQDLALFGQYQAEDGPGTFVLLASRDPDGWRRSGLLPFPDPFIVGVRYPESLGVFFCVGCDFGGRVVWAGEGYSFDPFPAAGIKP